MLKLALGLACLGLAAAAQQPGSPAAGTPASAAQSTPAPTATGSGRLPDTVFFQLDQNRDNVIDGSELAKPEAAAYRDRLSQADRNEDGRVSREEFSQMGQLPFYRDVKTAAAILLLLCFGAFCMFVDGLLDPEHREYFWHSIAATVVLGALAVWVGKSWFLEEAPYLAYVAAAPLVLLGLAAVLGATRPKEAVEGPKGPTVYKVGKPAAGAPGAKPASSPGPRRPSPPVRSPRPAPLPRPPVPERRPQTPPRSSPPRPPGSPPSGPPKSPPGK